MAEIRKYPRTGQDCPAGYKNCDGYIIPNEWSVVRFNSLFKRLTRKNDENNQNVLTISAQQGLVSQMDYYNTLYASENKAGYSLLHRGDFSYNKSYSSEYAYGAIKRLDAYDKGIVSPLYICFTPQKGTNSDFYLQYFEAGCFNREIYKIAQEGARNHGLLNVPTEDFFNSMLVFPPLAEQERIAEILIQCDKVIELKQKIVFELKQLKKVCLRKMFPAKGCDKPEIRFPEFTDAWEQRKFSDFTFSAGEKNKNGLPLEPYAITNEQGFIAQREAHNDFGYMQDVDRKMYLIVKPNSFAYNPARINVGSLGYYEGAKNVIVSSLYEVFQTIDDVDDIFLNQWFQTQYFKDWIEKLQEGSVRQYFYYDKLCECKIYIPSVKEQQQVGAYFKNLDNLITLHQRELEESKKKKKALAKLLLTGIVRVRI